MTGPWTFHEALEKSREASAAQRGAETFLRECFARFAEAERAYRVALAQTMVRLHAEGTAWTVCADVARGEHDVARLRHDRDVAEGVKEAAVQAAWRAAADRRDTARFADWSQRRELAENGADPHATYEPAIGGAR